MTLLRLPLVRPLVAALALTSAAHATAEPQKETAATSDDNARARQLYRASSEAFKAGKLEEAHDALLQAWSIRQTYDVSSSLAQVEMELGLYPAAAEHLDFAIKHFAPVESDQTLQQTKAAFENVRSRVAAVTIRVDEPGAEVSVDRRSVGTTPLASPAFLAAGTHVVEARLAGNVVSKTLIAQVGTDQVLDLALGVSRTPAEPKRDASRTEPKEDAPEKSLVPVVVGGAVFAAGLGMGIGFRVGGSNSHDRALALQANLPPGGCQPGAGSLGACTELRDAASSADRDYNISTAGFVLAGTAAVATVAYWLFWPEPKKETSVHLGAGATAKGAAAWLSADF